MRHFNALLAVSLAFTAQAQLVINEVDYDQVGTDNAEFLEILNTGDAAMDLANLQVVMINGNNGGAAEYRTLQDATWPVLAAGDYFVICGNQSLTLNCDFAASPATNLIQNGPTDAIALIWTEAPEPLVMDVLSYGGDVPGFTETTGTTAEDTNLNDGVSIGRDPNGSDTDNNDADFFLMCSTPGAENFIDPSACDLTTSVPTTVVDAGSLTVIPVSGGEHLMVYAREAMAVSMQLDVFAANGSLLYTATKASAAQAQWTIDTRAFHGALIMVRYTTSEKQRTVRIVVP